jgi:hypothetical protein
MREREEEKEKYKVGSGNKGILGEKRGQGEGEEDRRRSAKEIRKEGDEEAEIKKKE